jgi:hypothetical protein
MDTMLAALLLMFIGQAFGGERMSCEVQPVRGDGREWHYRTKVGGDPRICWYPGERMKPRSELYWDTETTRLSAPPSDAVEPKTLPSSRMTRLNPKTLLFSSLTLMATLPNPGARSMVAEQEASVQLLVGNDDRAAAFLPTETGLRGWACEMGYRGWSLRLACR